MAFVNSGAEVELVQVVEPLALPDASSDAQLVEIFLENAAEGSENTAKLYSRVVSRFLTFLRDLDTDLRHLTLPQLHDFYAGLKVAGFSGSTAATYMAVVKSLLRFALLAGYLSFNVGAALKVRRAKDRRVQRILSEDEVQMLLDAAMVPDRIVLLFLYGSALRVSELIALRWEDVHWPAGAAPLGAITVVEGKGDKQRTIPVAVEYLTALKDMASWDEGRGQGHIFRNRSGDKLTRQAINKLVERVRKQAGIEKPVSPHWFRHSHATHAAAAGVPQHVIQAQLGHASLTTTSVYMHLTPREGTGLALRVGREHAGS